jgi:hypothetical protein
MIFTNVGRRAIFTLTLCTTLLAACSGGSSPVVSQASATGTSGTSGSSGSSGSSSSGSSSSGSSSSGSSGSGSGGSGSGGSGSGGSGGSSQQPPSTPVGLAAKAGSSRVKLSWSASANAASYLLRRSAKKSGPYTQVSSTATTAAVDTSVVNGTTYYYVVAATDSAGTSANSSPVSATPADQTTVPPSSVYALPSDRATQWQPGVTYAPTSGEYVPANSPSGWSGGIPARTTICKTLSPSGSDDTAAINAALSSCPANQTVKLTTGKFVISGHGIVINNSYVTLRGSGPGPGMMGNALGTLPSASSGTLLVKSDGKTNSYPVITVGSLPELNVMAQTAAFATDAVQGANSVTLTSAPPSGLAPGEIVYVNETYDSTLTWFNTNGGQGSNSSGYNGWGEGEYSTPVAQSRPIGQAMEVASISGNKVTFTTPFHMDFRTSHAAHLGRVSVTARTSWVGIESLFVTGGDGGDGGGNIIFGTVSYSWASNIESAGHGPNYGGALVHFLASFRCELRDSYVHSNLADIPRISPGGAFYNIVVDSYAADNLVENDISWIANKVMVMRGTGGGNVIGYNYMDDGYGSSYPNQGEAALNADHMSTSHHELFEGNYSWSLSTDSRWGNSIYITWFRNWATAQRTSAWSGISSKSTAYGNPLTSYVYNQGGGEQFFYEDEYNRMMAGVGSHHWWFSFVGNVFASPSLPLLGNPRSYYNVPQTGYDYQWAGSTPASLDQSHVPIWVIGKADGSEKPFSGNGLDPSVLPVTLRDANFDFYTKTVFWHGIGGSSETQTAAPGASASGGSTLPDSLYLQSAPAFFGSGTWPWVDGSSSSNPLPGVLPARTRFNNGTPNAVSGG